MPRPLTIHVGTEGALHDSAKLRENEEAGRIAEGYGGETGAGADERSPVE